MEAQQQQQRQEEINIHRCHMCPITQDTAPRIALENSPWMYLHCGHRIHTNCFLEKSYTDDMAVIRFSCPVCQEHALTNHMVEWLQENTVNHFHIPARLENLWNETAELREDIKSLANLQRKHSSIIQAHKKECAQLKNEWRRAIHSSVEYIRLKKKEFKNRLISMPNRKKAIRSLNEIISTRANLLTKYPKLTWYDFSRMHTLPGGPKLKRYPRYGKWIFSGNRLFYIRF